jgi:hypothetical protein
VNGLTRSDQAKLALERLLEEEEIQAHLLTAATQLREASARVANRRPSKAVEDKKLYAKVREAAISLATAGRSLRAQPEPKHTGRKVALLAVAASGAAVVLKRRRGTTGQSPGPEAESSQTPAPGAGQDEEKTAGVTG